MIIMAEDNKNPFSQNDFTGSSQSKGGFKGSQNSDFGVNQFSSEQAKFPQFGSAHATESPMDKTNLSGESEDIRERIEAAKSNGWGSILGGLIGPHKNKILLAIAIVLLFSGVAYLSNKNSQGNIPASENTNISSVAPDSDNKLSLNDQDKIIDANKINILDIKINDDGEVIFPEDENISDARFDGSSITKTAVPGEGITHLARRAIKDYLTSTEESLNAEQRIYAEDYVQNRIGSESLEVGQKLSFSNDLLKEAIDSSQTLQDWQIENLKQYTSQVSLL